MAEPGELLGLAGRPTAELIADHLRDYVVQGYFRPGQQINESLLATQLKTSRGPLREALQRLCQEGILVSQRNRGVFVSELTDDDIREIYDVREAVETACARILLDGDPQKVKKTAQALKAIIANMAKKLASSNWQALTKLDMDFHAAFVAGAEHSRMIRIFGTVAAESRMCMMNLEVAYPRVDLLVAEHQQLLDLLVAGNEAELDQAIRTHMRRAVADLTQPANKPASV